MKIIIPCAGRSSRFPNMRPKWMLTHPDGNLMVKKAFEGLRGMPTKNLIITILKEHEDKYNIIKGLVENIGRDITIVVLDEPTKSAPETIYQTLKKLNLKESFLVRDSDNMFNIPKVDEDFNYVCFSDIQGYDDINPGNKSYIKMNDQGAIVDIVEKKVVSSFFNVGGYFFKSPEKFITSYEKLSGRNGSELYVSHIIEDLIVSEGEVFFGKEVDSYFDFGTAEAWFKYRQKFKSYFFDIDGVLFQNASQYFKPRWEDSVSIEENLAVIKKLSENPFCQIYFITSRPEKYRTMTEDKLKKCGIRYDALIMGCRHCKRIMINDFSNTTGYPSCEAINILRDSEDLKKYIL